MTRNPLLVLILLGVLVAGVLSPIAIATSASIGDVLQEKVRGTVSGTPAASTILPTSEPIGTDGKAPGDDRVQPPTEDPAQLWRSASAPSPNLTPYTPGGWDHPIVPSSVPGTHTVDPLCGNGTTYIDWAVINEAASTSATFYTALYFDSSPIQAWSTDGLNRGWYTYVEDWVLSLTPTPGWHTLRIVADVYDDIA
ncbi:MAG: hypothetical protein WBB22_08595, partial [Anaerolineae bacterium]